jgi:hypothetical protein
VQIMCCLPAAQDCYLGTTGFFDLGVTAALIHFRSGCRRWSLVADALVRLFTVGFFWQFWHTDAQGACLQQLGSWAKMGYGGPV